jgi:hypothetical protein
MSGLADDGFGGYLVLTLDGFLAHEPWRWLGLVLGRTLPADSEIFQWARAVATALVAALVMRLILFPAGALAGVELPLRLGAFAAGIACFFAGGRSMGLGVAGGAGALVMLIWAASR